jgi:hypothetical protein
MNRKALHMKFTPREKFLAKVCPDLASGCWLWQGLVRADGYGYLVFAGARRRAHRVAWLLFRGEIGFGLVVCHKCDVRACVNPEHLFLGTPDDNAQDMVAKGRTLRGEEHTSARLTAEQVSRIKTMLAEDRMHVSEIARQFGVAYTTIQAIKTGKTWRHVAARAMSVASSSNEQPDRDESSS